jgi:hypothetical protein
VWDATADNVVEQLAGLDDYTMAIAAYWAAVEARPRDKNSRCARALEWW